jgi:Xaa-Pro aminopeptidase
MKAGFRHRVGYSIGVAYPPLWWENDVMQLRPLDERPLIKGMTFHLVPGVHVAGLGFANQSMPLVTTESGREPLVDLPLRLAAA